MSALGSSQWRIVVDNRSGSALAASANTIKYRRFKFASDGSLSDEGSENSLTITASLGNNTVYTSSGIDNATAKYMGAQFRMEIASSASCTGTVTAYIQVSTDGGTTWADVTSGAVRGRAIMSTTDNSAAAKKDECLLY